jgi:hypothetical protein
MERTRQMPIRNAHAGRRVKSVVQSIKYSLAALLLLSSASVALASDLMPVSSVKKGMKGYGVTVFEGTKAEKFDVEIVGVLHNIGPGQDLILANVDHPVIKRAGVIAGMSGSPIYIDGKLIGALAYSWQFAKESIAGITPIEEMLKISRNGGSGAKLGTQIPASQFLAQLASRDASKSFEAMKAAFGGAGGIQSAVPIATPVSFGGFSRDTIEQFSPMLQRGGFMPVPTGTASAGTSTSNVNKDDPFAAGDAVAAILVDGDLNMAATGTVTYVDGDKVYGFGHPFLDMGEVRFPMATAEVVGVLPSLASSFKFSNTGTVVGAFSQDRAAGILGINGAKSDMIPVELTLDGSRGQEAYNFRIVRNAQLFPLLLAMATDSVVSSAQRAAGERTLAMDIEMQLDGFEPVKLHEGWSGMQARQAMPSYIALVANYIIANEFSPADIKRVKIQLRHDDSLKIARIMEAAIETPADGAINPGDTIKVNALLKPFRGEEFRESFEVEIPSSMSAGTAYLMLGSGSIANQLNFSIIPPDPRSLGHVLDVVRKLRSANELTASLFADTNGVVAGGAYQPSLPPSVAAVIHADSSNSLQAAVRYDSVRQVARSVGYIVDGAVKLDVTIRPKI